VEQLLKAPVGLLGKKTLTIKQTLRMFFNSAKNQIGEDEAFALMWETAQDLASKGQFAAVHPVPGPIGNQTLSQVAGGFIAMKIAFSSSTLVTGHF
jgi:hypothetical protein